MTSLAIVGHNKPPGPIEASDVTIDAIAAFMKENPVIDSEALAREAKLLCDRAKISLDEIEAERDALVRPLNDQVTAINAKYKGLHNTDKKKPGTFDRIFIELKARLEAFLIKEEQRRQAEAAAAAAAAEEAARIAREAIEKEQEAIANAKVGEVDVDVVAVTKEADASFADYERASRAAALAERESKVKLGGGFGKAASLRTVETLHLDSYNQAIKAIGPNDKIRDAILSAARDYRKANGELPAGVRATTDRVL